MCIVVKGSVPQLVQYQGSKRQLAPQILQYMPSKIDRLVEPFSGMAAISLAVAQTGRCSKFYINDLNKPLINLLKVVVEEPNSIVNDYRRVWERQFDYEDHVQHYFDVRNDFNAGNQTAANMLYLIARCSKGSVRYNQNGEFNQSPDKRRHGVQPKNLEKNAFAISKLLKGKVTFSSVDYREVLNNVQTNDFVYMDPPYQGVCDTRDCRYISGIMFDDFVESLRNLNSNNIGYIVSYDGVCGNKQYGVDLPPELGCKKIMLDAGKSSQATLLGKNEQTIEALYLGPNNVSVSGNRVQQTLDTVLA